VAKVERILMKSGANPIIAPDSGAISVRKRFEESAP
jgi:hypothetical protein